jgi:putative DNA primase/helicase
MVDYFQVINGLFLTPEMPDREGPYIPWGCGSNAKGTWARYFKRVMSKFYVQASSDVFVKTDGKRTAGGHTAHLIPLVDCRLAMCSEIEKSDSLNKKLLAGWTGGDPITARAPHGDQFEFVPQAKLCLQTNHKPKFDASDKAMTDRVRLIPCLARFTDNPGPGESKKDKEFVDQMDLNEVFTWMVRGAVKFYAAGKRTPDLPQTMREAQRDYFEDNDPVQQFIEQRCERSADAKIERTTLYQAFTSWSCVQEESNEMKAADFYAILISKGFQGKKVRGQRYFAGLGLIKN